MLALVAIPLVHASPVVILEPTPQPAVPEPAIPGGAVPEPAIPISTELPEARGSMDAARELEDAASRIRAILEANELPLDVKQQLYYELERMERQIQSLPKLIWYVSDPARAEALAEAVAEQQAARAKECLNGPSDLLHEEFCGVDARSVGETHDVVMNYANDQFSQHARRTVDWAVLTVWTEAGPIYARCPILHDTVPRAAECVEEGVDTVQPGVRPAVDRAIENARATVDDARPSVDDARATVDDAVAFVPEAVECSDGVSKRANDSASCAVYETKRFTWSTFSRWAGFGR